MVTTRTYDERLQTLANVRDEPASTSAAAGSWASASPSPTASACSTSSPTCPSRPTACPVNELVSIEGTPLEGAAPVEPFDFVRFIATARILMPNQLHPALRGPGSR